MREIAWGCTERVRKYLFIHKQHRFLLPVVAQPFYLITDQFCRFLRFLSTFISITKSSSSQIIFNRPSSVVTIARMTMEVDLDRELMNGFKTMNTTDKDVLITEFLRVSCPAIGRRLTVYLI